MIRLRLALALAACSLLDLGLVLAAGSGAGSLGWSCLAGCALYLLALDFIGDAGGICHGWSGCFPEKEVTGRRLESFKLGEFLYQLFNAVLLKLYCNLRVVPLTFATKDGSFTIFRMADARALAQASLAAGLGDVKFGAGKLLSPGGEEVGDVVHGGACGGDGAGARSDAGG